MNRRPGLSMSLTARHTVRFRLTLLYVGLFLASAAALLTITYVLVAQQLPPIGVTTSFNGSDNEVFISRGLTGQGLASQGPASQGQAPQGQTGQITGTQQSCPQAPDMILISPTQQSADMEQCIVQLSQQASAIRGNALSQLLIESGIALGIMAIVSIGLGWLMAGRVLRPLRTITATARRISARSLHQRISMTGPPDELKELGDTFDALLERLEASFRAQRQFVANASHELRTPLTRQRTLLEVALRDRRASMETLTLACEGALRASAQQERLIAAMLTLARGERGLDRFEPFDLAAITAETLLTRQADAASGQLTVEAMIGPALALGDASLAERLVANVIDNAIRHNHANGQIQVSTGTTSDGKAFITVSNSGPRIPPDQLPRLYQPFQRLDQARTGGTGLGLGLAIVQAIAVAHEAELIAQPNPDGGLTVQLRFLRADAEQRTALAAGAR